MFGLSFLTTLNIYKDYLRTIRDVAVAQKHNSTSVKKSVTENLVTPQTQKGPKNEKNISRVHIDFSFLTIQSKVIHTKYQH